MKNLFAIALLSIVFFTSCNETEGDTIIVVGRTDVNAVEVNTNITANTTWSGDSVYYLNSRTAVVSGVTLTIEPGCIIKGDAGTGANATALVIARGATLDARGTAANPIIMTSSADEIKTGSIVSPNLSADINGLWGGLIVLGAAPISASVEDASGNDVDVSELQIEGIPTSDSNGLYGGTVEADDSGDIAYVSVRHGGTNIGSGNEINGITLGGVGSGTSITWVEVVANADDGIEWFGGRVDVSKVLVWNSNDDALDTDQDWTGTCSDFIVVTPLGGSAFELDGPEGSAATVSGGFNTFDNGTIYAGGDIDHLVDWDGDTNTGLTNIYFYGIDEDYYADGAGSFNFVESFGGSVPAESGSWEYTAAAAVDPALLFTGVPAAALSAVAQNANTVGVKDATGFEWTFASASGALAEIGL